MTDLQSDGRIACLSYVLEEFVFQWVIIGNSYLLFGEYKHSDISGQIISRYSSAELCVSSAQLCEVLFLSKSDFGRNPYKISK